ncbi:MAG: acyl-CoA thioesterase [Pseudomonadota bacterium]
MYIWSRLIGYLTWHRMRARLGVTQPPVTDAFAVAKLEYRAWPGDVDYSFHINNGRYATIMDMGRTDLMMRAGLWDSVRDNKWVPIVSAIALRFRREVKLWQRFTLETRFVTWDDKLAIVEHVVRLRGGPRDGSVACAAFARVGFYDPKARSFVPTQKLMDMAGFDGAVPPLDLPEAAALLDIDAALRDVTDGKTREDVRRKRAQFAATPEI